MSIYEGKVALILDAAKILLEDEIENITNTTHTNVGEYELC